MTRSTTTASWCVLLLVGLASIATAARGGASQQTGKPFPDAPPGSWGDGFPSLESVLEYTRTGDQLETAKRRSAALMQLGNMAELALGHAGHPYYGWTYYREVDVALKAGLSEAEAKEAAQAWRQENSRRTQDRAARDAMVAALFTPEWRARHWEDFLQKEAVHEAELEATRREFSGEDAQDTPAEPPPSITIPTDVALPVLLGIVLGCVWLAWVRPARVQRRLAAEQAEGRSPSSFACGPRIIDVFTTTGTVPAGGFAKLEQTSVTVTSAQVTTHSSVRDDLHLVDDAGVESSFRLHGFDLACRPGNRLTVLHAVPRERGVGPYVIVQNRSTRRTWWDTQAVRRLAPASCLAPILLAGGLLLAAKAAGATVGVGFGIAIGGAVVLVAVIQSRRVRQATRHLEAILMAVEARDGSVP